MSSWILALFLVRGTGIITPSPVGLQTLYLSTRCPSTCSSTGSVEQLQLITYSDTRGVSAGALATSSAASGWDLVLVSKHFKASHRLPSLLPPDSRLNERIKSEPQKASTTEKHFKLKTSEWRRKQRGATGFNEKAPSRGRKIRIL